LTRPYALTRPAKPHALSSEISMRWFYIAVMCSVVGSASAAERPNVLFVVIDDLNDWVGCLGGHPQAQTPHIDRQRLDGVWIICGP
ncbi:MAG: hypothetical protein WBY88_05455, partial [Desulfosarcina sp.]